MNFQFFIFCNHFHINDCNWSNRLEINLSSAVDFEYQHYLVFPIYLTSLFFLVLYWLAIYFWLTQCKHISLDLFLCLQFDWINLIFMILWILLFSPIDLHVNPILFALCYRFLARYFLNLGFYIQGQLFLDVYCCHFFSKF